MTYADKLQIDVSKRTEERVPLTKEEIKERDATAVKAAAELAAQDAAMSRAVDAPAALKKAAPDWYSWSPAEMEKYISTQVKDLATAKRAMAKMAFAIWI